ncbi:hypothetical protein P7K49_032550 [Saguinus oedipus]|uniref:Uncharacterized protein n=1 Tax=Saguinus oedipus TaxID=9490 RepID=A0ABQ9TYJ7_SAGOE|nr:hypothetical protein P7K49_032550 [Saguinus oedipus]
MSRKGPLHQEKGTRRPWPETLEEQQERVWEEKATRRAPQWVLSMRLPREQDRLLHPLTCELEREEGGGAGIL